MVPYLRAANVKDGTLDLDDVKEMNFTPAEQVVFLLQPGDILVSEGSGSLRTVGASAVWQRELSGRVCFQNTLLRLRARRGTDPGFLAWWCRYAFADGLFASIATGANIFHISAERVRGLSMQAIPTAAQRAIANYLDAETARIDALIEKKRRMMKLLEERWAAEVRGVMTDSAWPTLPLRRRWTITDCKHRTPDYIEEGFPVVSPGEVTPGRLTLQGCHRFVTHGDFADLTSGDRRPRLGDIVYSRNASIGIAAYVDFDQPFTMGQDVCLIRTSSESNLWLMHALNSVGVDQLELMKIGSTFDRVNIRQLLDLRIPVPPRDQQDTIARSLDRSRARADRLRSALECQIDLLGEHRQALITAAVTGELEIPGAAA